MIETEGFRTAVGFAHPRILVFNAAGELLVFENGRHRISKIDTSGNVTRVIGDYMEVDGVTQMVIRLSSVQKYKWNGL